MPNCNDCEFCFHDYAKSEPYPKICADAIPGEREYGMPIEQTMKMYPNGCKGYRKSFAKYCEEGGAF